MEFDDPRLEPVAGAPTLDSLADFHQDAEHEYWCVWRYKGMEVRMVVQDNFVERVTFICDEPSHYNTLCFLSLIQHIGRRIPPWEIVANFNSRDGFIVKYIFNGHIDQVAEITQAPFGIGELDDNEQVELLDQIYTTVRSEYHVNEQLC